MSPSVLNPRENLSALISGLQGADWAMKKSDLQTLPDSTVNLRSSHDADGPNSVEVVAGQQVGNVILDLHLLSRKAGSLEQLRSGRAVVLRNGDKADR